ARTGSRLAMMSAPQVRRYRRSESAVFFKTKEEYGGLSNMAGGFPLCVNGVHILTSEALYQACRFPHLPEVQRLIIGQKSPMTAKMKSKPYRDDSRHDWDNVRVRVMRWCLRVKLAQHWDTFGALLLSTEHKSIVEESHRDTFWGAKPVDEEHLAGMNVLGRLLMELREQLDGPDAEALRIVYPPPISQFMLCDKEIGVIGMGANALQRRHADPTEAAAIQAEDQPQDFVQASFLAGR
ncbi:MAG TPA: NADAR family protein, partial [Thermomicrobiales bacterium]|nr:NADAR family protein [Thermomicrobiales bacterium]